MYVNMGMVVEHYGPTRLLAVILFRRWKLIRKKSVDTREKRESPRATVDNL